jgi:hypothetical protein
MESAQGDVCRSSGAQITLYLEDETAHKLKSVANRATLVTHNTREFSRVSDLKVVDWY